MADQPPPLDFEDDGDLFAVPTPSKPPATRTDDHDTSLRAAARVQAAQGTITWRVVEIAKQRGADGFIDADLLAAFPDSPESSHRKRRTELTAEDIIVDSGRTRQNEHGNAEIVWVHREFAPGPPVPANMAREDWQKLVTKLGDQAQFVNEAATQMLREGRTQFGRALNDLAHDLRQLRR